MSPERVRVTAPPRRRSTARVTRTRQIDQETQVGEVFLASLLREQRRLALRVLIGLGVLVALPLLFHLAPGLASTRLLGLPLPWWLLGVLAYPYLWLLGWFYVRRAEANERDFTALLREAEQ